MSLVRKRVYDLLKEDGRRIGTLENESEAILKVHQGEADCFVAVRCLFFDGHRQSQYESIAYFFMQDDLKQALESGEIVIAEDKVTD